MNEDLNEDLQREINTIFLHIEDEVITPDEGRLKVFSAIENHTE